MTSLRLSKKGIGNGVMVTIFGLMVAGILISSLGPDIFTNLVGANWTDAPVWLSPTILVVFAIAILGLVMRFVPKR